MTTGTDNVKDKMDKFKSLEFGTSGLRDKVTAMTDMEYYIKAVSSNGTDVYFPTTAPGINQTLVVSPAADGA